MVQELLKMMVERLQAYEKKTGGLPDRVIVYRDGVSEVRIVVANTCHCRNIDTTC